MRWKHVNTIDEAKAAANKAAREERKKAHLRGIMERYTERFRAVETQDAPALAVKCTRTIEALLERDRQRDAASGGIRCGRGCSHCCHGPVEIWPHEAALLVAAAREAGVELDLARLERQRRATVDTWRQQPAADTACVFLGGDGACRVYASRPERVPQAAGHVGSPAVRRRHERPGPRRALVELGSRDTRVRGAGSVRRRA